MNDRWFDTFMGRGPRQIAHFEHWSCPDAETYLTGIDYYEQPRQCRQRLQQLYPQLGLGVPESDAPRPRPRLGTGTDQASANLAAHTVRWGDAETASWEHGEAFFKTPDDVFAFHPLARPDFRDWPHVVMNWDFSSEEIIYQNLRRNFPAAWGDHAPADNSANAFFYNTMFMWPMLTFGWELFLECCLDPRFEPVLAEFTELNRRVFRAFARLPVNFVICHDDIVNTGGPVCSPAWMRKHIFPVYEELWDIVGRTGKRVIFMADGCLDAYVDDVMACGATGVVSEPYTDYKAIARRHPNSVLAGEGDSRILLRNNPTEIRQMVASMTETGRMSGGYLMCIGNHIPWDVPPPAIKLYLDLSAELARR